MSQSPRDDKTIANEAKNTLGIGSAGTDSSTAQTISLGAGAAAGNVSGATVMRSNDEALVRALATLPNYELLNKLGEGGMGAVYKARQRTLNRTVAIKVLPRHLCDNAMYVARLNREALVLAKINHPNVITCFDLGEHQGMRYVVMEFVEGEALSRLIDKRKQLPPMEALYYIKQSVLGLDCANALGIIHRDIKPDNMLLQKAVSTGTTVKLPAGFILKIADLGLATFTSEQTENTRLTTEGSTLGSPHYMSPEQTIGESDVDFRTDIYALGITLYHMLTGTVPYEAPTIGAVLAKKLSEPIQDPRKLRPELSPVISLLIHKMTARKKDDRYATYGDLLQDIEAIEQNRPLTAEILPDSRASLILLPETIKALKDAGKSAPAVISKSSVNQTSRAVPKSSNNAVIFGGIAALAVLAVLGVAGVLLVMPARNGNSTSQSTSIVKVESASPPPMPNTDPAPAVKKAPAVVAPVPEFNTAVPLIENHSPKGWEYKGDTKDFGYQDGSLYLQCLKGWNRAQRTLPANEYSLRAYIQTTAGVDDGEVQLGFDEKSYLAVGMRYPLNAKGVMVYVERRELASDKVVEVLSKRDDLNVEGWQKLKINVWERQATCFLDGQFLVSAELSETGAKCNFLRLATHNGIIQYGDLEAGPRPSTK